MPKHRKKTHLVDYWRSLCVRATLVGSGAANRPAQVFDVEIWNKLRQDASKPRLFPFQFQTNVVLRNILERRR
jgi:hypothetical protein